MILPCLPCWLIYVEDHGRQCRIQGKTETALLMTANGKSAGPGAFQDCASRRRSTNKRYAARNFVFQSIISGEGGKCPPHKFPLLNMPPYIVYEYTTLGVQLSSSIDMDDMEDDGRAPV